MSTFRTFILFISLSSHIFAADTCSRVAIINQQEVLIDNNSNELGEGLRFHLEKDPVAKSLLEEYQDGTKLRLVNTVMGSLGTGLMLTGIIAGGDSEQKKTFLIGGATLMILNFLVAKTLDNANEQNLIEAIDEYNKRNYPKIYYNPEQNDQSQPSPGLSFSIGKTWTF